MYARVSSYTGSPSDIDRFVKALGSNDRLSQMTGIRDAFLLVDRTSGKSLTVTLWDSEEAMRASAAGATQLRNEATGIAGGKVESVEVYEVALHLAEAAV